MRSTLRDIYDAVAQFSGGLGRRRITTYSAACAYYLFVALVPMLMLLVSLVQYTPLTQEAILAEVAGTYPIRSTRYSRRYSRASTAAAARR